METSDDERILGEGGDSISTTYKLYKLECDVHLPFLSFYHVVQSLFPCRVRSRSKCRGERESSLVSSQNLSLAHFYWDFQMHLVIQAIHRVCKTQNSNWRGRGSPLSFSPLFLASLESGGADLSINRCGREREREGSDFLFVIQFFNFSKV